MKKFVITSLITIFAITSGIYGQDLEKILSDHYKASGQDKAAKIDTRIMTGKNIITSMGMEMPFVITMARPNKIRVESSFNGSKIIQTFNGEKGWMLAPMMGSTEPNELSGPELKMLKSQGNMDGQLWNYEEKGNSVELVGEATVKDAPAYHIKITTPDGDVLEQYIDKSSGLISKIATNQVVGGVETEIESLLGDYKTIKGIAIPHSIITRMNGQMVTTVVVEDVKFNESVDPAIFDKPSL